MVQYKAGDYNNLFQFVSQNSQVVAQSEISSLLTEAGNAHKVGKEALAKTYVYHAVLLQRCSKFRPEERKSLFQRLANERETTKDFIADVNKAYEAIKGKFGAPNPQTQD